MPDPLRWRTWLARAGGLGVVAVVALALPAGAAAAAPGDLDPSFGGDGKLILPFNGHPEATLVQPDGTRLLADPPPDAVPDGDPDTGAEAGGGDGGSPRDLCPGEHARRRARSPDVGRRYGDVRRFRRAGRERLRRRPIDPLGSPAARDCG